MNFRYLQGLITKIAGLTTASILLVNNNALAGVEVGPGAKIQNLNVCGDVAMTIQGRIVTFKATIPQVSLNHIRIINPAVINYMKVNQQPIIGCEAFNPNKAYVTTSGDIYMNGRFQNVNINQI